MQNIINNTPFAAGKTLTKDARTGDDIYIIAVKATFDIETNGLLSVSKEQADVLKSPVYFGDECASSVEYPPDLSIQKERVDLIINASAHTPDHEPVCELTATVLLNDWGKELKVTGDRYWKNDFGRMGRSTPESFVKIPIVYENAFGGVDRSDDKIPVTERITFGENPVGTGFAVKSKYLEGMRLPNIEPASHKTQKNPKKNQSIGFGAIDGHWASRADFSGTCDENWNTQRYPLYPLDFNPLFYQWAPQDQQFDTINSNDTVSFYHLSEEEELHIKVPEVEIFFNTWKNAKTLHHEAKLQTLLADLNKRKLMLTWTAQLTGFKPDDELVTSIKCRINI